MGRATRFYRLETRSARARLPIRDAPYWCSVSQGLHVGYRKGPWGGSWIVRVYSAGRYAKKVVGEADDARDPNGADVLSYFQAQERARAIADGSVVKEPDAPPVILTVDRALDDYLAWFAQHKRSLVQTKSAVEAHIRPHFKGRLVADLTTREIRRWFESLATAPRRSRRKKNIPPDKRQEQPPLTDPEAIRGRRAAANRILAVFKAVLNRAWHEDLVPSDSAWRRVSPFKNVDAPRIRFLREDEARRLVNVCAPDFRDIVKAALHTGARYGDLIGLKVRDVDLTAGTVLFPLPKSGKRYSVPLSDEGRDFFRNMAAGRPGDAPVFLRSNGDPWKKSHQSRRMIEACRKAKITPAIGFHILRHTYASALVSRGVSLQIVSEVLGHSGDTRMASKHYAHIAPSHVAEIVRKHLPSLGGEKKKVAVIGR